MSLSDTYVPPVSAKRRYKIYSRTFHVDENTEKRRARKKSIDEAEKVKPHKRRAIARDRKYKYDECRGEEEPVNMYEEEFNAVLSSRVAKPFTIMYSFNYTLYYETYDRHGKTKLIPHMFPRTEVVARGTLYKGKKNEVDITVVHEVHDYKVRRIFECDFAITEKTLFNTVYGAGQFMTVF